MPNVLPVGETLQCRDVICARTCLTQLTGVVAVTTLARERVVAVDALAVVETR